jgi:methionine-rich copper-binding protein CopC/uncharacterized membrane protein
MVAMKWLSRCSSALCVVLVALPLALVLTLLLPAPVRAHAILLRSEPAKDAVLSVPPQQVRMWFSEALNPAISTAVVVNSTNQRVDSQSVLVLPNDSREMDLTLPQSMSPGVYVVVWRTASADDGHILSGSFLFTIARPDGTVPTLSAGTIPGQNALGSGASTGQSNGQIDGPTLFNLIMITLVELGAVFWVGLSLWLIFVLGPATEDHAELGALHQHVQERIARRIALPTLLVLLLAHVGVLMGQAVTITGGNVAATLSPSLLGSLITGGRFGMYWLIRVLVIVLAVRLALYRHQWKQRPPHLIHWLAWADLLLGLALFIALVMSSHAAAVSSQVVVLRAARRLSPPAGSCSVGRWHDDHCYQLSASTSRACAQRASVCAGDRVTLLHPLGRSRSAHHGGDRPV